MVEVHHRGGLGSQPIEIAPVVARPVGNGDHVQVGSYPKHCVELCAEHRLQRRLLRLGHAREGDGIEPLALGIVERQRRTACLLIPCRPAWRERSRVSARFASATITPSSETATATASSGTPHSNCSRLASQRALSPLGKRSRELFDGAMLPNSPSNAAPSFGVICATTQLA